jgi:DNA-directed RNA polymerase subunit RPC12/RpoP
MSMIMVLACSEGFNFRALGGKSLLMLLAILGGIVLCVVSLRLYLFILFRAEHLAEQSACGGCGSYGLLRITSAASGVEAEEETLGVQCRKCGHRWTIGLGRSD